VLDWPEEDRMNSGDNLAVRSGGLVLGGTKGSPEGSMIGNGPPPDSVTAPAT
jgi:hypothetical protein